MCTLICIKHTYALSTDVGKSDADFFLSSLYMWLTPVEVSVMKVTYLDHQMQHSSNYPNKQQLRSLICSREQLHEKKVIFTHSWADKTKNDQSGWFLAKYATTGAIKLQGWAELCLQLKVQSKTQGPFQSYLHRSTSHHFQWILVCRTLP